MFSFLRRKQRHFFCTTCDRHYPWERNVTGGIFNGKKYCRECFIERVCAWSTTMPSGYPAYTWHGVIKQLKRIFKIRVHLTRDPEKVKVILYSGEYAFSTIENPNKCDYRDWDNKFEWIFNLVRQLNDIPKIKTNGSRLSHGSAGNPDC